MSDFVLSCCSAADLSVEHMKKRNIHYLCFHYFLNEKEHIEDFGETLPLKEFYKMMVDGVVTKTSQLGIEDYRSYFEKFLKEGKDVLHLTLSSGISGTYNSAMLAKSMLDKEYPDRKLIVLDSLAASSGFGLLVDKLADLRDEGKTIEEVASWCEENKLRVNHWFFSTDLTFYIRGGRVSKTSGFIGNMLHICPLLNVNFEGRLIPREKILGKKKAILVTEIKMENLADNGLNYADKCFISHSNSEADALALKNLVESKFTNLKGKVEVFDIGTTIGSHSGPGTIALYFMGAKRVN